MTNVLIIDDNRTPAELVGRELSERLGFDVEVLDDVAQVSAEYCASRRFELALVDLAFRGSKLSGLDALVTLHSASRDTRLVVYTQGDDWVAPTLLLAWEAIPLASVISKSMSLAGLVSTISRVARDGSAPIDPVLAPFLPSVRTPGRSADRFVRLVGHAGHAKLWRALRNSGPDASYDELAQLTGLKVNTLKNYRDQLLPELEIHGLERPAMRDLREFSIRCAPLLEPFIRARIGQAGEVSG